MCGDTPGVPDEKHSGYGRLLRDLDGHLHTFNGRYWWIYRAVRNVSGVPHYRPWLANAPTLETAPWIKEPTIAFQPADTSHTKLFTVGSFVRAANRHWIYYAEELTTNGSYTNYRIGSSGLSFNFTDRQTQVIAFPLDRPRVHGGNVIRHPNTGQQYLVQACAAQGNAATQVWVHRRAS